VNLCAEVGARRKRRNQTGALIATDLVADIWAMGILAVLAGPGSRRKSMTTECKDRRKKRKCD
jgi:hypothetical protein